MQTPWKIQTPDPATLFDVGGPRWDKSYKEYELLLQQKVMEDNM